MKSFTKVGTNKKWPMRQTELSAKITIQFGYRVQHDLHVDHICVLVSISLLIRRDLRICPRTPGLHPFLPSSHYCLPIVILLHYLLQSLSSLCSFTSHKHPEAAQFHFAAHNTPHSHLHNSVVEDPVAHYIVVVVHHRRNSCLPEQSLGFERLRGVFACGGDVGRSICLSCQHLHL